MSRKELHLGRATFFTNDVASFKGKNKILTNKKMNNKVWFAQELDLL